MNPQSLLMPAEAPGRVPPAQASISLPLVLGSRVANIILNAQVQLVYACAVAARKRAQQASASIERSWPDTPVRRLVVDIYRAQAQSAELVAREVLQGARRRVGLAFAPL